MKTIIQNITNILKLFYLDLNDTQNDYLRVRHLKYSLRKLILLINNTGAERNQITAKCF